jgi:hypothetical protein
MRAEKCSPKWHFLPVLWRSSFGRKETKHRVSTKRRGNTKAPWSSHADGLYSIITKVKHTRNSRHNVWTLVVGKVDSQMEITSPLTQSVGWVATTIILNYTTYIVVMFRIQLGTMWMDLWLLTNLESIAELWSNCQIQVSLGRQMYKYVISAMWLCYLLWILFCSKKRFLWCWVDTMFYVLLKQVGRLNLCKHVLVLSCY